MTEGERWARELLAELRAARFTPRALVRFLARSFARAGERRRERSRERREALVLGAAGLAGWAGVALAGRPGLAAAGAGWWLLVWLMLDWHLGMLERPDGTPIGRLGAANLLGLLRAGLVPALPAVSPAVLAALLAAAGAADVLDGPLARARGEVTRLGLWLDGAVDALVLPVAAVAAARAGRLEWWAAALVLARYGLPWAVVTVAYFARAAAPPRAGYVSGRVPGLVLFAGLGLAVLEIPGGTSLAAAGALGGLLTFAASVGRTLGRSAPEAAR